jgi:hypothetical protein
VVLDSGADISLLPQEMADGGQSTKRLAKTVLEDAQGGRLRTYGRRSAQIEMEGENDEFIVIEDDFVVSSVRCSLISFGRLLHKGWTMRPNAMAPAGVTKDVKSPCSSSAAAWQFLLTFEWSMWLMIMDILGKFWILSPVL